MPDYDNILFNPPAPLAKVTLLDTPTARSRWILMSSPQRDRLLVACSLRLGECHSPRPVQQMKPLQLHLAEAEPDRPSLTTRLYFYWHCDQLGPGSHIASN